MQLTEWNREAYQRRLAHFRKGQEDRKEGGDSRGPLSTHGAYLDGWYSPDQQVPDFLTAEQTAELENA